MPDLRTHVFRRSSLRPSLAVPPYFFSFAKCGGFPTGINLDCLPHAEASPNKLIFAWAEPEELQPTDFVLPATKTMFSSFSFRVAEIASNLDHVSKLVQTHHTTVDTQFLHSLQFG